MTGFAQRPGVPAPTRCDARNVGASKQMLLSIAPFAALRRIRMTVPSRLPLWCWPLLAGLIASLNYGWRHRTGIEVNADGWAYWQGAQSIADGSGYRYFSGDPIIAWPPLYSLYLSTWIAPFGSEAIVLVFANSVLIFTQGLAWTFDYQCFAGNRFEANRINYPAFYIALTISLYEGSVLAHELFYTILPFFIGSSWMTIHHDGRRQSHSMMLTCALGVALVESHISGLVYIAAAASFFFVRRKGGGRGRAAGALAILTIPSVAWIATAWRLGQFGGHPLDGGRFSFLQTLSQMADGIGYFVLPSSKQALGIVCSLAIFGVLLFRALEPKGERRLFVFIFTTISLALLAIAFSITWLNGFVSESRHLLVVPLLAIPILISYLMSSRTVAMRVLAFSVFIMPVTRTMNSDGSIDPQQWVPIHAAISPIPRFGRTVNVAGRMLVGPIRWEEPEGGYSSSGAPRWGASQNGAVR